MGIAKPARGERRGGRPISRGGDSPVSRTTLRPVGRTGFSRQKPDPDAPPFVGDGAPDSPLAPRFRRGWRLTQRALVLLVVLVVLLVSYATTLRVYLEQEQRIARSRQQIAEHEQNNATLDEEIARWEDPEYVKIQARERLGWVMPGETGYRVIGPNGEVYGGGGQITGQQPGDADEQQIWWDHMWGSVRVADDPLWVPEEIEPPGGP